MLNDCDPRAEGAVKEYMPEVALFEQAKGLAWWLKCGVLHNPLVIKLRTPYNRSIINSNVERQVGKKTENKSKKLNASR